jgi:hypothetical protein
MRERQKVLEEMGVDVQRGGIGIDASKCYLMNMTFDPASKLLLLYNINVRVCACFGFTCMQPWSVVQDELKVGSGGEEAVDIQLSGKTILPLHAVLRFQDQQVTLHAFHPFACLAIVLDLSASACVSAHSCLLVAVVPRACCGHSVGQWEASKGQNPPSTKPAYCIQRQSSLSRTLPCSGN